MGWDGVGGGGGGGGGGGVGGGGGEGDFVSSVGRVKQRGCAQRTTLLVEGSIHKRRPQGAKGRGGRKRCVQCTFSAILIIVEGPTSGGIG